MKNTLEQNRFFESDRTSRFIDSPKRFEFSD